MVVARVDAFRRAERAQDSPRQRVRAHMQGNLVGMRFLVVQSLWVLKLSDSMSVEVWVGVSRCVALERVCRESFGKAARRNMQNDNDCNTFICDESFLIDEWDAYECILEVWANFMMLCCCNDFLQKCRVSIKHIVFL